MPLSYAKSSDSTIESRRDFLCTVCDIHIFLPVCLDDFYSFILLSLVCSTCLPHLLIGLHSLFHFLSLHLIYIIPLVSCRTQVSPSITRLVCTFCVWGGGNQGLQNVFWGCTVYFNMLSICPLLQTCL